MNGPHTLTKLIDVVSFPKSEDEWDKFDKKMTQLNAKAMNVLHCALDANKFNHIFTCNLAKKT